jgi:hypothetical protein
MVVDNLFRFNLIVPSSFEGTPLSVSVAAAKVLGLARERMDRMWIIFIVRRVDIRCFSSSIRLIAQTIMIVIEDRSSSV